MGKKDNYPIIIIACNVFQGLLEPYIPDGHVRQVQYLEYGLHQIPKNLKIAIQEQIDQIETPSLIILGYGLCGNGLDGINSGMHTLLIPRTDDCIAILLGSYQAYRREFDSMPGTYYLSKGWLESGSNPLEEYGELVIKYGEEKAKWLMDYQYRNYKRLALVAHTQDDLEKYRQRAQEVAEYCSQWGMQYCELLGSEEYVKGLMQAAFALDKVGEDFLIIPPGGELKQGQFIR